MVLESGKTTLARNLYNNGEVKNHFKHKAWVSLPQQWDASHEELLLSELIRQMITGSSRSPNNLHRVASQSSDHDQIDAGDNRQVTMKKKLRLQNLLKTELCLVVLDDVWDWKVETPSTDP